MLELPALSFRYDKEFVVTIFTKPLTFGMLRTYHGSILLASGIEGRRGNTMSPVLLESVLVQVELHAEDKVGVLDHAVGDQEGHGGQGGQTVHLANKDEDQGYHRNG